MLKRFFSIITISLVITGSFFSAYNIKYPVYADSSDDGWTQVTSNQQLVDAFKAYCKSRDLTIEGSVADAITSFTTQTFNGIVNTLGIDITQLQANIKYQTDGNLGTKFLFNTLSIDAYNRIFAQFLQDNELEIGDSANEQDNTVYSGKYFTDDDGNTCLVYYVDSYSAGWGDWNTTTMSKVGTYLKYSTNSVVSMVNNGATELTFHINNTTYTIPCNFVTKSGGIGYGQPSWSAYQAQDYYFYKVIDIPSTYGHPTIIYYPRQDILYLGVITHNFNGDPTKYCILPKYRLNGSTASNGNVYLTTNNTVINNNTYEGDTIINNNGDVIINPDNPDNPDNPNDPDLPPSNPTIPDDGGWQDFSLPDMPNDWLIYGMEKKFPFDIPFNIMFALSLLNHEPQIPKFEGDIDLQVCTWHYDIDLTPFDDIATILRRFEVLAFIIGLAILTKELINWG